MKRRIFGIETEYGITCASLTGSLPPLDAEQAAAELFASMLAHVKSTNAYIENGARTYLDVGAHPEYATAECDNLEDLIANERAGDAIFARMALEANERLRAKGIPGQIHLFKNNLDSQGNSFGSHENYLIHRSRDYRRSIETLVPFFVTRQLLVGAGYLHRNSEETRFEISPRAWQMWDAVSSASTRARPMINTRDEPHGDPDRFRRMHVIVGDSTMSQTATALRVGMTCAVLDVLEDGGDLPDLTLRDPVVAIRETSKDLTGGALLELEDGRWMTALEVQQAFYEAVMDHYAREGWGDSLLPIESKVFEYWKQILEGFVSGNRESLSTIVDWVAKLALIEAYQARSGASLSDPRVARLDLAWHDVTQSGLRTRLETSGALETLVSEDAIEQAMQVAPQTTRARLRGEFIRQARAHRRDFMADWMNLRLLADSGSQSVLLSDPFASSDPRVDELLMTIAQKAAN